MEPLPARLLCERQLTSSENPGVPVVWSNVIGPFVIPTAMYRLNDNNEGAFEVFENPPDDITGAVEHREFVKLQSLFVAVVRELAKKPVPKDGGKKKKPAAPPPPPEDDDMLDEAAEGPADEGAAEEPEDLRAPLKNVFLVPVCSDAKDVDALLFANASDPDVVDYTGVVAFAWYIETFGDADKALYGALEAILESNRFRINGAPRGSSAVQAGQGGARYRSDLRKNVEAMNGPTPHHDLQQCMFSLNYKMTEDWAITFRSAGDMAFMFHTVLTGWEYDADDVRTCHIVSLLTKEVGGPEFNNGMPEFYRMPQTACIPLRDGDDGVTLGAAGKGLLAFSVRAADINFSKVSKLTRFPLLRGYSSDKALAARERVRFKFIKTEPVMLNPQNKEGVIRRLRIHTSDQLQNACWDMTMLMPAGKKVAEREGALPILGPPLIPSEVRSSAEDDDDEGVVGWWKMRGNRPGDWELDKPYDVAGGPSSILPPPGGTRIRLTACLTLGYADVVAGAHLRVEEYGGVEETKLRISGDEVMLPSETLCDPRMSSMMCKRKASVLFARVGRNAGPEWPSRDDWVLDRGIWRPKRRLRWRCGDGKLHVICSVKVRSDPTAAEDDGMGDQMPMPAEGSSRARSTSKGPRVVMYSREVRPERWVAIRATRDPAGLEQVFIPSTYEARSRMMRRLETDAEEALRQDSLLPDSYVRSFKWFRTTTERFRRTSRPPGASLVWESPRGGWRGFEFVYRNLNGHMNYYAGFLLHIEYAFNVRYYHPQIYKCYLGFRHTSKTWDDNVKMLHHILFGPPGAGKSFAIDLCKRFTPPGFSLPVSHESAQNKFVKLANVDQLTSIVVIHDEANAAQLGLQEASDGRNHRAQNSLSQQAVEYKEMLTSRRNTSCVLETSKDNGRTREMFEVSTDMVQFQLMNNFPSLAPPMMSRFMSCCFYKFPRLDAAECKQRAPNADRDRLADRFAEMQQVLYVLQAKLDTLQAVGICAPVPEEGWKIMASEFERVLTESFPFAMSESLTLDRKLQDGFQYVRMMVNAYAIYVTFGHPKAPFYDLGTVTLEAFRTAERYIVPSDEMMYMALSMLESDIFPNGEVNVLSCICEMAEARIRASSSISTVANGQADHLAQPEVPIPNLYSDWMHTNELMEEEALEAGAGEIQQAIRMHAFVPLPVPGKPPFLWRSILAMKERITEIRGPQAKKVDLFANTGLPAVDKSEIPTLISKIQYVSVYESVASGEDDFLKSASNEIYKMMQGKENSAMPIDHVSKALFQLTCRSMKDNEALRDAEYARSMVEVVGVEEVGEGIGNRKRYRLIVAKVALDELRKGGLTIKAVFNLMQHRYSKPGTYLLNSPYAISSGKNTQYLPQLADAAQIREHKKGCPAMNAVPCVYAEANQRLVAFAASKKRDTFCADHSWPWASDHMLQGCVCYRSRRIPLATGCSMPDLIRNSFVAMLGGAESSIAQNGLGGTSTAMLESTVEHLGWVAHVTRLTGRSPDGMTAAELEEANLQHAHPSSTHWISGGPSQMYPYDEKTVYQSSMSNRPQPTTNAQREAMFPTDTVPDGLDHPVFREAMRGGRA